MIKKRYFEMVNLIMNSNNEITVRDIADLYSITERSVRYDVNELNIFFNRKGKKNLLEISNNKLRLLCNRKEIDEIIKRIDITEYLLNEEERVMRLAYEIFLLKDRFILQYFTEKYGLSKTTIRNSLKELNQIIGEYSLVIELDNNITDIFSSLRAINNIRPIRFVIRCRNFYSTVVWLTRSWIIFQSKRTFMRH